MDDINNIDIERLRYDLIQFFGPGTVFNPMAVMILGEIEKADAYKLIEIAKNHDFDLNDYRDNYRKR